MDVILLERVGKLGHIGETVRVKDGYARNFLLPRGKALRATDANKKKFEVRRADLEARNNELKRSAGEVAEKLDGATVVIIRQAGETGQLYGSVSARDIAEALTAAGHKVERGHVAIQQPIKTLGLHTVADSPASRGRVEGHRQRRALARAGRTAGEGRRPLGARTDLDGRPGPRSRQGAGRGRTERQPRAVTRRGARKFTRPNDFRGLTALCATFCAPRRRIAPVHDPSLVIARSGRRSNPGAWDGDGDPGSPRRAGALLAMTGERLVPAGRPTREFRFGRRRNRTPGKPGEDFAKRNDVSYRWQ